MTPWDRIIAELNNVEDIDRAVAASNVLDQAADESCLPQLHQLLSQSKNFFVREAAAVPIARLEGLRALPQLLRALELGQEEGHDNDGLVSVISDLVWTNPEEAAPVLLKMIKDPSERSRRNAAWLWGFAAKVLPTEPLLVLLSDPSSCVRSAAVGSLGSFKGCENAFASLVEALKDPDDQVKMSGASALGFFGDKRAVPPLRALFSDSSPSVQRFVEYALKQLGRGD